MNKILALSGRKQSGKNTAFNFLLGIELLKLAIVRGKIEVRTDGRLAISDIFGDEQYEGIFDIDRNNEVTTKFCSDFIWPFIRNYSFADCLKQDVCINLLGLTHEQCYGTDEQKNELTSILWEDMPGLNYHAVGQMTSRQVMQYVGTDIFRKIHEPVWSEGTINRIIKHDSRMAIITDARFPNEVDVVHKHGGRVIRFTRGQNSRDEHESESVLDKDRYDWGNFDAVIDNMDMTISEQNEALYQVLYQWEWIDKVEVPVEIESGV